MIFAPVSQMPGDPFTAPQNFSGVNGMATLELRFQINCAVMTGFYGVDCNTFCLDTNDTTGHYTCDQDGMRVCLDGYLNPATNCTECIPAEGCCKLICISNHNSWYHSEFNLIFSASWRFLHLSGRMYMSQ